MCRLLLSLFLLASHLHAQLPDSLPSPERSVGVDQPPEPLNLSAVQRQVRFPLSLEAAQVRGEMRWRVQVDATGRMQASHLLQGLHPELDRRVAAVLPQLRFTPACHAGRAIAAWRQLTFTFDEHYLRRQRRPTDSVNFLKHPAGTSRRGSQLALTRGLAAFAEGQYFQAEWHLQASIRMNPRHKRPRPAQVESLFMAHYYLAKTEAALARWPAAQRHWTEAIGLALSSGRGTARVRDLMPQAVLGRSRSHLQQGHFLAAIEDCLWLRQEKEDPALLARVYQLLSQVAAAQKDYATALTHIQQAIDLRPTAGTFYLAKARILLTLGGKAAACEILQAVPTRDLSAADRSTLLILKAQTCTQPLSAAADQE